MNAYVIPVARGMICSYEMERSIPMILAGTVLYNRTTVDLHDWTVQVLKSVIFTLTILIRQLNGVN